MKIAFVNQPIDAIVPPYQNSVGACTYWVARPLAKSTEVLVYGVKDLNPGDPAALAAEYGIQFRFFPATWFDRLLFNLRRVLQYFSWDAIAEGLRNRYEAIRKPVVNLV